MTNRTYTRPCSAGVVIKRPRLRRLEISFDGPPPPTPEGTLNNGFRPHGGVRGSKNFPPGQFSFDKDEDYHNAINNEYQLLVTNDMADGHGAPYWLSDVQREITHSGESPLFSTKLLAPSKIEQEHGVINLERALLSVKSRRPQVPRRQYLQGKREYYRPNSTHHYLSATDLKNLNNDDDDQMVKYGRPTRTTLLRARQRTGSAPVSSYDSRREHLKRLEDVRNNAVYTSKESCTINSDGETLHSFLTGARYNRAHLIDSRGMSVYGVYMPRDHTADCFMTGNRRIKDGEEIPVAPPDSPRSDYEETVTPQMSRPPSSGHSRASNLSRPTSNRSSNRTASAKTSYSRTPSRVPSSRPRSSREVPPLPLNSRVQTAKSTDSNKREGLPDELTLAMPDHINKGKSGVYVTLKGQKMIETVDSKLPRVTGVSFPNLRKSRDVMDEMLYVNQPPPTPVDVSAAGSMDKHRIESQLRNIDGKYPEDPAAIDNPISEPDAEVIDQTKTVEQEATEEAPPVDVKEDLGKVTVAENKISDRKTVEIGLVKHVNFTEDAGDTGVESERKVDDRKDENTEEQETTATNKNENVVFFMTEDEGKETDAVETKVEETVSEDVQESKDTEKEDTPVPDNKTTEQQEEPATVTTETSQLSADTVSGSSENDNGKDVVPETVDSYIKVEISEPEKKDSEEIGDDNSPVTAEEYPFDDQK